MSLISFKHQLKTCLHFETTLLGEKGRSTNWTLFSPVCQIFLDSSLLWEQLLPISHMTCIMSTFLQRLICFHVLSLSSYLGIFQPLQDDEGIPAIAKYFNTKGRYEEVNPYLREDLFAVNMSILQAPSAQCREIYLIAVIRHGTRYPATKNIKDMQRLYNIILHNATGEHGWLQEIQSHWRMWYFNEMDGRLVEKGVDDLKHLAVRLSKLFPSIISHEKLRRGFFKILTSSKHRCVDSTLAFKAGLMEQWDITGTSGSSHKVPKSWCSLCVKAKKNVLNRGLQVYSLLNSREARLYATSVQETNVTSAFYIKHRL